MTAALIYVDDTSATPIVIRIAPMISRNVNLSCKTTAAAMLIMITLRP
jgi:hypothetical protein